MVTSKKIKIKKSRTTGKIYHPTTWQIKNPLKRNNSQSFQSIFPVVLDFLILIFFDVTIMISVGTFFFKQHTKYENLYYNYCNQ
jgi:hypothetical protein